MGLLPRQIKKELMDQEEVEEIENTLSKRSSSDADDGWETHDTDKDTDWVTSLDGDESDNQ